MQSGLLLEGEAKNEVLCAMCVPRSPSPLSLSSCTQCGGASLPDLLVVKVCPQQCSFIGTSVSYEENLQQVVIRTGGGLRHRFHSDKRLQGNEFIIQQLAPQ